MKKWKQKYSIAGKSEERAHSAPKNRRPALRHKKTSGRGCDRRSMNFFWLVFYTATTFFLRLGRERGVSFFILLGTRVLEKKALQRCLLSKGQSMIFQQGV